MKAQELFELVGQKAMIAVGSGLSIGVEILDAKVQWGRIRIQVSPLNGEGTTWVDAESRIRVPTTYPESQETILPEPR